MVVMNSKYDSIKNLGQRVGIEKGGVEQIYLCPKCGKPKFYVNLKKEKSHCFSCSYSTKTIRFFKSVARAFVPAEKPEEDKPLTQVDLPGETMHLTYAISGFLASRNVDYMWAASQRWLTGASGKWEGRLVIPIKEQGKLMCWVARSIDGREPKELAGPNRSHFFYGYDDVVQGSSVYAEHAHPDVVLVEGIFDQIRISSYGANCLALLGSSLSEIQAGKLLAMKPKNVILMFDGDEAGRKATEVTYDKLSKRMNAMNVKKVYLPDGKDPDNLTREEYEEATH